MGESSGFGRSDQFREKPSPRLIRFDPGWRVKDGTVDVVESAMTEWSPRLYMNLYRDATRGPFSVGDDGLDR